MFRCKKISSDFLMLALLVAHLRLNSDLRNNRWNSESESREVLLGTSSAYTQINIHLPYPRYQHFHPKSLEYNEIDELEFLFSRLNYLRSASLRANNLIAYYASSPCTRPPPTENPSSDANGNEGNAVDPALPSGASDNTPPDIETACDNNQASIPSENQDLSPEKF